jgi:D-alanyl-D-alanine carboxypeptidase
MKLIRLLFLTILITSLYQSLSLASPVSDLQSIVDQYLQTHNKDEHISTVALTAQCNGFNLSQPSSVFTGYLSFNSSPLTDQNSIFQIGSVTKSFVAVVLLQLEDEKKYNFSIEDDMEKWFPEYPKWYGIKIKQLLNMTSGIPEYEDDPSFFFALILNPTRYWKLEEIINYEVNKPLDFPPGTGWKYSNTNYTLLGLLIRKITTNEPNFEITNRIINKLSLKNTFYIDDQPPKELKNRLAHGYTNLFGQFIDTVDFSLSGANTAGAIISTTEDINKYTHALFASEKLLTQAQFLKLTSFVSEKNGQPVSGPTKYDQNVFGLGIVGSYSESNGIQYVYEGSTPGFRFLYTYYPSRSISIVTSLNSDLQGKEWDLLDSVFNKIDKQCLPIHHK